MSKTCDWMARFPDSTKLVHMNLPRTHNTATWNYSAATQASLVHYTEKSIFQRLNDGVCIFDLRIAYNPGNDTIGFHHSTVMLAPHTNVEDVFFGFHNWLDNHPTKAMLISINFEGGTGTLNDVQLQTHLHDI
ncbi:hypothetical protein L208DRAFT_1379480 [Tricholoma matsutake]|nr:hypothetical protein L208DRAFT_1379480 [Tricholoma matsutake 945]